MRKLNVITEGPEDAALLRLLLPRAAHGSSVEIIIRNGQGWSEADTMASSILAVMREPVVLILDAAARDTRVLDMRRSELSDLLGLHAPESMWRIILVVPEMEALFFRDPDLLRSTLDARLDDWLLYRAKFEPRVVLEELLDRAGITYLEFLAKLESADLSLLVSAPEICEIMEFSGASESDVRRAAGS